MMLHVVMSEYLESVQKLNTVSRKSHHRFPADRWYVCSESLSPGYVDRVERQLILLRMSSAILVDLSTAVSFRQIFLSSGKNLRSGYLNVGVIYALPIIMLLFLLC